MNASTLDQFYELLFLWQPVSHVTLNEVSHVTFERSLPCHPERSPRPSGQAEKGDTHLISIMKHYYVYILKCCDDSYYTGVTSNLEGRLIEHEDINIRNVIQLQGFPLSQSFGKVLSSDTCHRFRKTGKRLEPEEKRSFDRQKLEQVKTAGRLQE